jgi:hypothetical protein
MDAKSGIAGPGPARVVTATASRLAAGLPDLHQANSGNMTSQLGGVRAPIRCEVLDERMV